MWEIVPVRSNFAHSAVLRIEENIKILEKIFSLSALSENFFVCMAASMLKVYSTHIQSLNKQRLMVLHPFHRIEGTEKIY